MKIATAKQNQTIYDCKGVPIVEGDLIRTPHFRDRRNRRYWLYHVVTMRSGVLEMVPTHQAATGKAQGGACWLFAMAGDDGVIEGEVLHGYPYPDERRRIKVGAKP